MEVCVTPMEGITVGRDVEVELFTDSGSGNEIGGGSFIFTNNGVRIERGANRPVPGVDYQNLSTIITLTTQESVCVRVEILQDLTFEENETFFITIQSSDDAVKIQHASAEVILIDSDSKSRLSKEACDFIYTLFEFLYSN